MTTATLEPVDQLYAAAAAKAAANPPGRALATGVLAVFSAIGWVLGVLYTGMWFVGVSFAYGFSKGSTGIPKRPAPDPVATAPGGSAL